MERGQLIENYGKKEQKEWLDNTLPDPHPCTAGNKEEEHTYQMFLLIHMLLMPVLGVTTCMYYLSRAHHLM